MSQEDFVAKSVRIGVSLCLRKRQHRASRCHQLSCILPNSKPPQHAVSLQTFNEQSLSFQEKLIARSGLGQETYLPDGEHLAHACSSYAYENS